MQSDDRLVLRLPSDLKAMFTALCENEGVSISAKLKEMMASEVQKKLDKSMYRQDSFELMPRKPVKVSASHSKVVVGTTLPEKNNPPLNVKIGSLFDLIDEDTEVNFVPVKNNPVQSAINAQNKRKPKRKKR